MRFPEFSDPWQQTTLGEIGAYLRGVTYSSSDISQYGIPIMRATNINSGTTLNYTSDVIRANARIAKNQILQKGDIVICAANGSSDLVGKNSYYDGSSKEPITVGAFCGIYRSECILSRWIFQTYLYRKYIQTAIQGGNGSIANLKPTVVLEQVYALPSLAEQRKIAEFLSLIDERIETQRQTIEERKKQKKALLHQIFSQSLRFPDFSDPWQQTTLGEVAEITSGYSGEQEQIETPYRVSRIETISSGAIDINRVGFVPYDTRLEGYKLSLGDILFSNINSIEHIGKSAIVSKPMDLYHGMNLLRLKVINAEPYILYSHFQRDVVRNRFRSIANKAVSQASINQTALGKESVSLPSLAEQRKIAEFLSLIDERIEVEEKLLGKYEEQKKYLLRKMFV
ncbi:restriction endonuclease subunit S [Porphyromonadaceae bacterium W3.11]|nr:restriction endonuclease subunit S [Porphyromonadaceae bacterium W3.11]